MNVICGKADFFGGVGAQNVADNFKNVNLDSIACWGRWDLDLMPNYEAITSTKLRHVPIFYAVILSALEVRGECV